MSELSDDGLDLLYTIDRIMPDMGLTEPELVESLMEAAERIDPTGTPCKFCGKICGDELPGGFIVELRYGGCFDCVMGAEDTDE